MNRWFSLLAAIAILGCSDASQQKKDASKSNSKPVAQKKPSTDNQPADKKSPEANPIPKEIKDAAKTVEQAREVLQGRLDRVLGGQPIGKAIVGSIAIWAVGKKMASMDIVRVVQKYDKEGKPVPSEFVAVIRCVGEDTITGRRETREFESIVFGFRKGEWTLVF